MRVLGIDPGASGALVVLDNDQPVEWMEMPTYQPSSHRKVNCAELSAWIDNLQVEKAFIEQVHAMPGQGVSSMFYFGHSVGSVMGVLGALKIPVKEIRPVVWKKRAGLLNTDKDAARSKAINIWPKWRALDKKIKGQALADAALIALFGDGNDA